MKKERKKGREGGGEGGREGGHSPATLVARTIFLRPGGGGAKISRCWSIGSWEWRGYRRQLRA